MIGIDTDAPAPDPPDADAVYARYLETCKRIDVEPMPRDRARDLMAVWADSIAGRRLDAPTTHWF